MYTYHWYQWLAFFYIYCFFGWIFESTYVSLRKHCLINRGFLRLPLLPIYGSGAVLILWVSLPVQNSLILVYFSGALAATMLEYVTGYTMERLFKMRYWDYSTQHIQLYGYICLSSSIAWGFLSLLLTEVIHQPIERLVIHFPTVLLICCVCFITAAFCADAWQSTKEALALGSTLELLASIKEEMDELEARLETIREEAAAHAEERFAAAKAETDVRLKQARLHTKERLEQAKLRSESQREALELRLSELKEKRRLAAHAKSRLGHFYRRQLLKGNPTASSHFSDALKELKEKLEA